MNRRLLLMGACFLLGARIVTGQEDPGRARIGAVTVTVYHATDGDPEAAGKRAKSVSREVTERLSSEERLRFKHYSRLGEQTENLLRSYESWAQPLKPSDEILVRFEAQGVPSKEAAMLDLELWLARKKIVKSVARLEGNRPLFVLGPEWRGGRLIIAIALAPKTK